MYHEHFGLDRAPFRITPDTDLFYAGGGRGEVLEALVYAVESGEGIVKVVGEVGTGKTMLCRMLETRLPDTVEVVYLANPSLEPDEILHAIALEMSLPVAPEAGRLQVLHALHERLLAKHAAGRRVVALVEEAQSMPIATLEEIRLLSNLETQRDKLLQIVLFGQPELDLSLERPEIRQLRERITHSFYLQPFTREQVREYVNFRLRAVGYRGPDVFRGGAYSSMNRASEGLTRRVNILADKALLAAFADDTHSVQRRHVRIAIDDSRFDRHKRRAKGIGVALVVIAAAAVTAGAVFYQDPGRMPVWLARWMSAPPPGTHAPAVSATGASGAGAAPTSAAPTAAMAPVSTARTGAGGVAGAVTPVAKASAPASPSAKAAVSTATAPLVTPPATAVRATGSPAAPAAGAVHRQRAEAVAQPVPPAPAKPVTGAPVAMAVGAVDTAPGTPSAAAPAAGGALAHGARETPAERPRAATAPPADTSPPVRMPVSAGTVPGAKPAPAPAPAPAHASSTTTGTTTGTNTIVAAVAPVRSAATATGPAKALPAAGGSSTGEAPVLVPLSAVSPDNALLYSRVQATRQWLRRVDPEHFSIQLLLADVGHQANLEAFLQRLYKSGDIDKVYVYETTIGARTWFGVLYGEYPTIAEAQAALQALPAALKRQKPFIRNVHDIAALR